MITNEDIVRWQELKLQYDSLADTLKQQREEATKYCREHSHDEEVKNAGNLPMYRVIWDSDASRTVYYAMRAEIGKIIKQRVKIHAQIQSEIWDKL